MINSNSNFELKDFKQWIPTVFELSEEESNIDYYNSIFENETEGLFFPTSSIPYVFKGSEDLDSNQCEELGVKIFELDYAGGTLVGESEDLPFLIVAPKDLNLSGEIILKCIKNILSKYFPTSPIIISNNDILLKSKKIFGSFVRETENKIYFGGQFSFVEHKELISALCEKKTNKTPGHINPEYLLKDKLRQDIESWLVEKKIPKGGM
jgi:lipoate-protein ligase A